MERGAFIVLEGIDGSGTTTQVAHLVRHLQAAGLDARATREPSDGPIGRLLREILLGNHGLPSGAGVEGGTMALLFAADRRDHLAREIEPALGTGCVVVSDRYVLSSFAYQREEARRDWVRGLAADILLPDLTILLDVPAPVAAARRRAAGRPTERYDDDAIQTRIAENYRALSGGDETVCVLDGTGPVAEVATAVAATVDALLRRRVSRQPRIFR